MTHKCRPYLNFSNFRGQTSAGGGQALVQKWGHVSDGGDWQNFCRMGRTPPVPPGKNPGTMRLQQVWDPVRCQFAFCIIHKLRQQVTLAVRGPQSIFCVTVFSPY